ncbi:hypothetical protein [Sphingobium fuliginis]|uniref:hypothetical protein n=1 Tax=Sphingobium fuliginis (strain ATCC 27551) TaxID=336203 RepID=UPI0004019EEE
MGQLAVLKTPDVSLSSSSIGATVNISYPKPFDHPGTRVAMSAAGSVQDDAGKIVRRSAACSAPPLPTTQWASLSTRSIPVAIPR